MKSRRWFTTIIDMSYIIGQATLPGDKHGAAPDLLSKCGLFGGGAAKRILVIKPKRGKVVSMGKLTGKQAKV